MYAVQHRTAQLPRSLANLQLRPLTAAETLEQVAFDRPGASLEQVDAAAALQTRVDRKYLITSQQMRQLAGALGDRFSALQIGGKRLMSYDSTYFDTPSLELFRAHRQGRRRRFKVRARTYVDSGTSFMEVKTKGGRGETVKHRIPHSTRDPQQLDGAALEFVEATIREQYDVAVPPLVPVQRSQYRRTSLVDLTGGARLTCDVDLRWSDPGLHATPADPGDGATSRPTDSGEGAAPRGAGLVEGDRGVTGPDKILLESKTTGRGRVDRLLAELGIRPLSMSKYALGTALLHPDLAANKWNRLLREEFDWHRTAG